MLTRAAIMLSVLAIAGRAEQGVLVLHVGNPEGQPLQGVQLSTLGDGSSGPPTDRAGKSRIRLAPQTRPGDWVSLQIARAPRELAFISPWDGRVRVPPFENESDNFAPVVLAARGDRALLETGKALAALAAKINAAVMTEKPNLATPEEIRRQALNEVAELFGLDRDDLDRALQRLAKVSADPYERGMSALYQGRLRAASRQLARALEERESAAPPVAGNIVNAALFLGQSLYEQGKYAQAVEPLKRALELRPDDARALHLIGTALLKSGKPAEAEPYLRKALSLQETAK
jgi:hypothetical protein